MSTIWSEASLSNIVQIIRGVTYKGSDALNHPKDGFIGVLRATNIQSGKLILDDLVYVPIKEVSDAQLIKRGDIVVAMSSGSKTIVGKAAIAIEDINAGFGAFCGVLRPSRLINYHYVGFFTESLDYRNKVSELSAGANINNLKPAHFSVIKLPIPPLPEQKVIVETLDSLLAQVESTKARLESIPGILKQFRQSVLAAAVSGELTEDWREEHFFSKNDWKVSIFSTIIDKIRSGSGDKPSDGKDGVRVLRSSAVRDRNIDYSDSRYFDASSDIKIENTLEDGDLLFTRLSGSPEYVGNCALVHDLQDEIIQYPDRIFCAKVINRNYLPYLEIFFSSQVFKRHISLHIKSSAGHQRITLEAIKKARVDLPPEKEQEEIVRRVEELFGFADKVAAQVKTAMESVNHLTQSILAQAFSGELTKDWREQNPDLISGENSAAALLERIKAEREKLKAGKKG